MYPFFTLFGKTIGTYAILSVFGILSCVILTFFITKKKNISIDNIILLTVSCGIGLFVGSHLLYGITNIPYIIKLFSNAGLYSTGQFFDKILESFGGMVFYGGFLGALLAAYIASKIIKDLNTDDAMDIFSINVPLFHVFGRIGCFFGGCCYGIESKFGFLITNNTVNPSINGVTRLPVQLIEAFCNLLIFIALLYIFKKDFAKGHICLFYIFLYAPTRFVLEFFRGDSARGFLFSVSTSQWISILLFTCALIYIFTKKLSFLKKQ